MYRNPQSEAGSVMPVFSALLYYRAVGDLNSNPTSSTRGCSKGRPGAKRRTLEKYSGNGTSTELSQPY